MNFLIQQFFHQVTAESTVPSPCGPRPPLPHHTHNSKSSGAVMTYGVSPLTEGITKDVSRELLFKGTVPEALSLVMAPFHLSPPPELL